MQTTQKLLALTALAFSAAGARALPTDESFGVDLNGNGENDKMKFTLVALTAGDANRTFITLPDGTVLDSYDAVMDLSGAILDESQDPPFGPITLTGPVTATSKLVGVTSTPDGGSTLLCSPAHWPAYVESAAFGNRIDLRPHKIPFG